MIFKPNLSILPPPQLQLWPELDSTPEHFTLYGGTALALHLGHRASVDFDFFSDEPFDPDELIAVVPYLKGAERVQIARNTLKCRVECGGPVLVSFFGGLGLGKAAPSDQPEGRRLHVASLLDLAGTKVAVVQKRAEAKDYLDIDALIQHGVDLPTALAAGMIVYRSSFNPMITLKALSFFDDVPALPVEVRKRLAAAVDDVDPARLPSLVPYREQTEAP
ncbi:MAG: nucleotidyl transferase AbiEii/AbiGii toxin family protein [Syntrophobacteraceae bacterium]